MYNCAAWAIQCLNSCKMQTYTNWQAIIGIEPSDDNTAEVVSQYKTLICDDRFIILHNKIRVGVPKNQLDCIAASNPKDDDVIIFLDGDDSLYCDDALDYLNNIYLDKNIWITWGSYVYLHDKHRGGAATPMLNIPNIRKGRWAYSHVKTFRYFLWKNIKDEDLRYSKTGQYYTVAGDMAIMYPMLEMAGRKHARYIDKLLYVYNYSSPFNDDKIHSGTGKAFAAEIQNRPQYKEKTKAELLQCR